MDPFTALKKLSSFHFTSYFIFYYFFLLILSTLYFTLPFISTTHFTSLSFTFSSYRLHFPSLVFTFLALVLKTRVLPWEVISLSLFRFACLESRLPQEFLSNTLNTGLCTLCWPSKGRNNDN